MGLILSLHTRAHKHTICSLFLFQSLSFLSVFLPFDVCLWLFDVGLLSVLYVRVKSLRLLLYNLQSFHDGLFSFPAISLRFYTKLCFVGQWLAVV